MASQVKLGSLALALMLCSSCKGEGSQVTQHTTLDLAFQKAVKEASNIQKLTLHPCGAYDAWDYKYTACFSDTSGSAQPTAQRLNAILTAAGFKSATSGSMDSELDRSYTLPGTAFTLNMSFNNNEFDWIVYQKGTGRVQPRPEDGQDATYALRSASQMADLMAYTYLRHVPLTPTQAKQPTKYQPCATPTTTQASVCLSMPLSAQQTYQPFIDLYFAGNAQTFKATNSKPTFQYRYVSDIEKSMIKDGTLPKDYAPAEEFMKERAGVYTRTDAKNHPAYKFMFTLTPQGQSFQVQITATRIPTKK